METILILIFFNLIAIMPYFYGSLEPYIYFLSDIAISISLLIVVLKFICKEPLRESLTTSYYILLVVVNSTLLSKVITVDLISFYALNKKAMVFSFLIMIVLPIIYYYYLIWICKSGNSILIDKVSNYNYSKLSNNIKLIKFWHPLFVLMYMTLLISTSLISLRSILIDVKLLLFISVTILFIGLGILSYVLLILNAYKTVLEEHTRLVRNNMIMACVSSLSLISYYAVVSLYMVISY